MKLVQKVVCKCSTVLVLIVDNEICNIKSFWYHSILYQNPGPIFYSTVSMNNARKVATSVDLFSAEMSLKHEISLMPLSSCLCDLLLLKIFSS